MAKRSVAETVEESGPSLHPKYSEYLVAHQAAEKQLLAMQNAGRLPHALLFTGPQGIGKATLAYRLARFLLSPPDTAGGGLFGDNLPPETLHVGALSPTFKRMALGSHPDLLVLESKDIKVEEARLVAEFLSLTPAEGAWRVVIIDSADAMNRSAANALLKILEEPPAQAVLILVSHNPGTLLPTIRSRCRVLRLQPLGEADFARIMAGIAPELTPQEIQAAAILSGCSPGVALSLIESKADRLYREICEHMNAPDTLTLHHFAERFARKESDKEWQAFRRLFLWLLSRIATSAGQSAEVFAGERSALGRLLQAKPPGSWIDLWEKSGKLLSDTEHLHLDRKQAIITVLRAVAE